MNVRKVLLGSALAIETLVTRAGQLGGWLMLPLIFLIVLDASMRKFFRSMDFVIDNNLHEYMNSSKIQEMEWHLHTMVFFLAIAFTYSRNMHVRLDMFRSHFSERTRIKIEVAGAIFLLLPFLLVLNYHAIDFVNAAWVTGESSSTATGLGSRWAIKSFVVIGFTLMTLIALSLLVRFTLFLSGASSQSTQLEYFVDAKEPDNTATPKI